MPRRRSDIDADLQEIYGQIPDIPNCKGLCWMSCGPIGMSQRERQRIREAGIRITGYHEARAWQEEYWCEALGSDGRCQIYGLRPTVCRLWGAVESMRCPYGCVPEGGFLPEGEGHQLLAEAMAAGGDDEGRINDPEMMRRLAADPRVQQMLAELRDRGAAGDDARIRRHHGELPDAVKRRKARKTQ